MGNENPIVYRKHDGAAAIFFVHGFTGSAAATWGDFQKLLVADRELVDHDVFSWGYPTKLNLAYTITKHFWSDDPNIQTIGHGLRTELDHRAGGYQRLVLVGHSMGGLIIQAFILGEILNRRPQHLDRLTEVVLMGTPSGGLKQAQWGSFLKNQIADMSAAGEFIQDLRSQWKQLIDDQRPNLKRAANFRLSLVAGMKDTFVPQSSSLDPFPLDDKEVVPGNHTEMVKPISSADLVYLVLKQRLSRGTLTRSEWERINGESAEVIQAINRIRAAAALGDTADLVDLAGERLALQHSTMPLVDRALGLALLDHEQYQPAVDLLARFLEFKVPGTGGKPYARDAQAIQQLAIALSAVNRIREAVARLSQLEPQLQGDPETQGILAGRFKRQWLKSRNSDSLGWRAHDLYKAAFESAKPANPGQAFYNGINAAYMSFALGGDDYPGLANEVLMICQNLERPDYWAVATGAEAHLLLRHYDQAAQAYQDASRREHPKRHWSSTGQQALDILRRQGDPPAAEPIRAMFAHIVPDI
jgi:pimeloyl-ACP methyl ester carboxylesterase